MSELKKGDRVRLKCDHTATGQIDEVWFNEAAVVWDISGCVSDVVLDELEEDTDDE